MADIAVPPASPVVSNAKEPRVLPVMPEKWNEMKDLLSCPVCSHLFRGRINQCLNGHSVCQDCRSTMVNCPLCREVVSRTRNFVLESLIALCGFKCKYYKQGCKKNVTIAEHEQHSSVCNYRSIWCAAIGFDQCQQGMKFTEYLSHLNDHHHVKTFPNEHFIQGNYKRRCCTITTSREKFVDAIITFGSKQFILQFKIMDEQRNSVHTMQEAHLNRVICCWWVSMFSPGDNDCDDYVCEISVRSRAEGKATSCKMSWEGKVKPLRARGSEINQIGCLTTTLGNILKRDFPPGENGRLKLGVAYEVSAIIKRVPALLPDLCDEDNNCGPMPAALKESKEVQTDEMEDNDLTKILMKNAAKYWSLFLNQAVDISSQIYESEMAQTIWKLCVENELVILLVLVFTRFLYAACIFE